MHFIQAQKSPRFIQSRPKNARKATEIDMVDGIVDMGAFSQIIALDEGDLTKEFSKTLVTAWCDQAELAVEEMLSFLEAGNMIAAANKAHYLKGSSASLGLSQVSETCQAIYLLHFSPVVVHHRHTSYSGNNSSDYFYGDSASSSSGSSSFSRSSSSSGSDSSSSRWSSGSPGGVNTPSSSTSSLTEKSAGQFDCAKIIRARELLIQLKYQIKEASEWLVVYYTASDKYAAM